VAFPLHCWPLCSPSHRPVILGSMGRAASAFSYTRAAADAWRGRPVRMAGVRVSVPGPRRIRLSVVGGNIRIHRLIDALARPGSTVVDVGANIGYNTLYAARRVGPEGRVIAIEPSPDNLAVAASNVDAARLSNVILRPVAAGRSPGRRD